ncbi:MAG: FtsH protease activity modulator HflK [Dehalococcoidia bacterium]
MARRPGGGSDFDRMLESFGPAARNLSRRFRGLGFILIMLVVGLIVVIWLATGIYQVDTGQLGIVRVFGKEVDQTAPGLHWRWPGPIGKIDKVRVEEIRRLEIGFRVVDPGPPATITPFPVESLMVTGDENLVDVKMAVQVRITSGPVGTTIDEQDKFLVTPRDRGASAFIFNVSDPGGSPDQITLRDAAETALRQVVGEGSLDDVLTEERSAVEDKVKLILEELMLIYGTGLQIVRVQIQSVDPPSQVQAAFDDVVAAKEDRVRLINQAEAFANDIIPKARGEAEKIILDAEAEQRRRVASALGEAAHFEAVLAEYRQAPLVTRTRLYLETIEKVLAKTREFVLSEGAGGSLLPILPLSDTSQENQAAAAGASQ